MFETVTLMEGSIVEQLRRDPSIEIHPSLVNTPLIYSEAGGEALKELYNGYIAVARKAGVPFTMTTPTWRTNYYRVARSEFPETINRDIVQFMKTIVSENSDVEIQLGGLMGCKNDCYKPEEALSIEDSRLFSSWQVQELADAGVDYLIAETLPELNEAIGIAQSMEQTDLPYFISFVLGKTGNLIDGTSLDLAIKQIDSLVSRKPDGYLVNCAYPTFIKMEQITSRVKRRLIGFMANGSSLSHDELDGSEVLYQEHIDQWVKDMLELQMKAHLTVLGGCCGTGVDHLSRMMNH